MAWIDHKTEIEWEGRISNDTNKNEPGEICRFAATAKNVLITQRTINFDLF